jgi:hypothetical protein
VSAARQRIQSTLSAVSIKTSENLQTLDLVSERHVRRQLDIHAWKLAQLPENSQLRSTSMIFIVGTANIDCRSSSPCRTMSSVCHALNDHESRRPGCGRVFIGGGLGGGDGVCAGDAGGDTSCPWLARTASRWRSRLCLVLPKLCDAGSCTRVFDRLVSFACLGLSTDVNDLGLLSSSEESRGGSLLGS